MDEKSAGITVVVPAYHSASTIRGAISSALTQNHGNVEVIVVVDDELPDTPDCVEQMGDERVSVVVNARNMGAPASRNRGLRLARHPYVVFLDADDYYRGELLGPLVRLMSDEEAVIGFGPSLHWSPAAGYTRLFVPDYRDHEDVFVRWFGAINHVAINSVVWSTEHLREIGGWDESIQRNQDGELALRAILLGSPFVNSAEGAGVWVDDQAAARITTRTDNLDSLLLVNEKLLAIRSNVVDRTVQVEACAANYLRIAWQCFYAGRDCAGREALERSRRLGFTGTVGPLPFRILTAVFGVAGAARLSKFRRHILNSAGCRIVRAR
jgi:glycosyltransferase involved in cell wall biosynthesis